MKRSRRFIAVIAICGLLTTGCTSLWQWSPSAQANIQKFNTYAAQFLAGVKANAPAILAIASAIPQAAPYVPIASASIAALEAVTVAAQATSTAAMDPTGVAVSSAQAAVSSAVGAVQNAINSAQTGTVPNIAPVPTISVAPVGALK
jgi:hypothetical protein